MPTDQHNAPRDQAPGAVPAQGAGVAGAAKPGAAPISRGRPGVMVAWADTAGRCAYLGTVVLVFAFTFLPVVFVMWVSLFSNAIITFPPEGYTAQWYVRAWENRDFTSGFITSIQLALLSMVVGLLIGAPAAFAVVRGRFPGRNMLNALLLSPLVVPGIVAGTAIYVFFVQIEIFTGVRMVTTLPGLMAAHVMLTIPWTVRLIGASLVNIDPAMEEAAKNLGAGSLTVFYRITLPIIKPGVVAAAIFAFIASFTDLEMTLFLVGPNRSTLQIALLQYLEWRFDPSIAAVSVVQIIIIGTALVVTDRYVKLARVV